MVEIRPKKISERIESYNYLLYRIGDTYFAKNGLSGNIDYSSVNFKSVYDAVSAVLTVDGGTVVLRAGDVFVSSVELSGVSNVSVEGYGATLQVQSNTGGVHALTFDSIVNSVWRGVNVERVGVDAGGSHVLYVSGVTDESVKFLDCNFTNSVTGTATNCHGVYSGGSACPSFSSCTITGGSGGTYCYGVSSVDSACPSFSDCTIDIQTFSSSWSYSSADDGRFQPFSTHPYILRGIYVSVASATSGVTLDLGTSVSGTEIASGIDISSTGSKYFNFTSPVEVAGDGYFYATPSGATVNGAFTVSYIVSTNYASSYGAVIDTVGYMLMSGCTVVSNGASDALRIASNSVSYPYFKVTNCHLESLDATNQYAISASGALADAPIYNSVLVHNLLNVTPDAGTQQGTNWQDPLVAYQEALPISNEYVTKLLNLVAKERLDHTTLYFTSTPLTDLVSLEGLEGKDLDDAILANKDIEVQNALLIKEAKSLAQIVLERTDKTVEELVPADEKIAPPVYLKESPIK